jgi:hypothetical protein
MILQILAVGLLAIIVYFVVIPYFKCYSILKRLKSPSKIVFFPLAGYMAKALVIYGKERDLLDWLPKQKKP